MKEQWCLPPQASAEFVCALEDVLEVYTRPYDPRFPQVCLDEASKQLIGEVRPPLAPRPGHPACFDFEYERKGVASLFLLCEPLRGWRQVVVTDRRTKVEWAHMIRDLVDVHHPQAIRIVLVVDNLNTHTKAALYEVFVPSEAKRLADKIELHYTPKHASWLNMAEIELSCLQRQCLDRRIPDADTLRHECAAWVARRNQQEVKINWRFTTADARIKLKRLYPSIHG